MFEIPAASRRAVLQAGAGAMAMGLLSGTTSAGAQPRGPDAPAMRVTQLLDMSPDQQELSRDYSTGIRLAFAELKRTGAFVAQLSTVETDGTAASVRQALQGVKDDPGQLALVGSVGEGLALAALEESARLGLDIAHVAPWLADSRFDADARLFALFASREEQIRHALRNLASLGVAELGLVYPNPQQERALQPGTAAATTRLNMKARSWTVAAGDDIASFAARLPADAPIFLVFMGGGIELAQFVRGLVSRKLQRYVICLSDVDPSAFVQLHPGRSVPIIFTQIVPDPNSAKTPVVRAYQDALKRFFDEAPSPMSLAGYLSGRYAAAVLASVATPTRARVLAEFQRRRPVEFQGYRLAFDGRARASSHVSQTMLTAQGQLIG